VLIVYASQLFVCYDLGLISCRGGFVQGVATHVQEAKSLEELVRTDITAAVSGNGELHLSLTFLILFLFWRGGVDLGQGVLGPNPDLCFDSKRNFGWHTQTDLLEEGERITHQL
jgi:hypothetical protein